MKKERKRDISRKTKIKLTKYQYDNKKQANKGMFVSHQKVFIVHQ